MKQDWTFEGYWNTVLGANRSASDVVREFDLDPSDRRGLDEWLGTAESEAWTQGRCAGDLRDAWSQHHARALESLAGATEDADPKAMALAAHLQVDTSSIEQTRHSDDTYECESEPGEYQVLTSDEREEAADKALESYIDECIFGNLRGEYGKRDGMSDMIDTLERYFDRAAWKRDALINDGYGHTLSGYDGQEHEQKIGDTWYYIYRVNR